MQVIYFTFENKSKFLLVHSSLGFKHSLKEVKFDTNRICFTFISVHKISAMYSGVESSNFN